MTTHHHHLPHMRLTSAGQLLVTGLCALCLLAGIYKVLRSRTGPGVRPRPGLRFKAAIVLQLCHQVHVLQHVLRAQWRRPVLAKAHLHNHMKEAVNRFNGNYPSFFLYIYLSLFLSFSIVFNTSLISADDGQNCPCFFFAQIYLSIFFVENNLFIYKVHHNFPLNSLHLFKIFIHFLQFIYKFWRIFVNLLLKF